MTLRHWLAPSWLAAHRAFHGLRGPTSGFRILLFHDIPERASGAFRQLVDYVVHAHGVLRPSDVSAWLRGEQSARPNNAARLPCLFSFDDGFVSNYRVATSVLSEFGVNAIFFVLPGLVDLSGDAQREAIAANVFDGRVRPTDFAPDFRLMTWKELRDLKRLGHEIGCHGMSHLRLPGLDPSQLNDEIVAAGDLLDSRLEQRTSWYAYPFGDLHSIDRRSLEIIARRFDYCRSGLRGRNDVSVSPLALNADSLVPSAPMTFQKLLMEGGFDFHYGSGRRHLANLTSDLAVSGMSKQT